LIEELRLQYHTTLHVWAVDDEINTSAHILAQSAKWDKDGTLIPALCSSKVAVEHWHREREEYFQRVAHFATPDWLARQDEKDRELRTSVEASSGPLGRGMHHLHLGSGSLENVRQPIESHSLQHDAQSQQ
jgi:hypothetical protein